MGAAENDQAEAAGTIGVMVPAVTLPFLLLLFGLSGAVLASQRAGPAAAKIPSTPGKAATFNQVSEAADRARTENRDDDAIRLYQQALHLRPAWKEGLWYLSTLLYEKERYPAARDLLRRFVSHEQDAGPAWAMLGLSEFQTREYTRSLDHLLRAMALGMDNRKDLAQSVFYFVAVLRTRFEQFDESMSLLMAMVKSGQPSDLLIEPIGLAALRMPLLPSEVPPNRRDMIHLAGQGALALEAQDREGADRLLSKMVAAYPDEPGVHFLYGAFLLDVRPTEGMAEMQREMEISPSSVPARLRLAEEYLKQSNLDQALPLADQALRLEPHRATAHMIMGEVLVAKDSLEGAIRELETAEQEAPQTVRIRWDLLRAYAAAGRSSDAQREKEEIAKLNRPDAER
jgi:predicted Zn-dependent protease